jgi:L-aminopeptidase/D-esterase-like protein
MAKSQKKTFRYQKSGCITDVPGISVGHASNIEARTGCTVILCGEVGAVCGVDVRGAAPGTRETDLLNPSNLVERVHAILLAGGSAFGLDAATGVMRFLEELGIGYDTGVARVPIVPAAVIFDLAVGNPQIRPDAAMGYNACANATDKRVKEGQVGAGTGAMVGKILGMPYASPGGIGSASMKLANGATVGVLVVVNAMGDIIDPESGDILAGAKHPNKRGFLNTQRAIEQGITRESFTVDSNNASAISNTTLAVVVTDAALTKAQAR